MVKTKITELVGYDKLPAEQNAAATIASYSVTISKLRSF